MKANSRGRPATERAISAGGVVGRRGQKGIEVVVCGRESDGVWGLPKGKPDQGETLEAAAVREVSEETGLDVEIAAKVGVIEYWFRQDGRRYHKWVHHYLMKAVGGDTTKHDLEYDRVEWMPVEEAIKRLTYRNEVEIIAKAREMLEEKSDLLSER